MVNDILWKKNQDNQRAYFSATFGREFEFIREKNYIEKKNKIFLNNTNNRRKLLFNFFLISERWY